jgi:putative peptide maturation dehydrogenase
VALAPHLGQEIVLDVAEMLALAEVEEARWQNFSEVAARVDAGILRRLLDLGLLVSEAAPAAERDGALRDTHWHPLACVGHAFSRWTGVGDNEDVMQTRHAGMTGLVKRHGLPPPHVYSRGPADERLPLPAPVADDLDALLQSRVTCRNFDAQVRLPLQALSSILARTFGCQAQMEVIPDAWLVKKNHPSGGGLHPLEAYLLLRDVEGVASGLYHYHAGDHALEPLQMLDESAAAQQARQFLAGQEFFAEAQVMIAVVPRFVRTFWKYRQHAKAYRVVVLEAGHLSQNLYLCAGALGLGAYVTAAINEIEIEQAFGLDALQESPLAACGFGLRRAEKRTVELDPLGKIWPLDSKTEQAG